MRSVLVPAVNVAPSASIINMNINVDGFVSASAQITGGKEPYLFHWGSSSTEIDAETAAQGPDIAYGFNPKEPVEFETLTLQVTDANGITTQASSTIPVPASPALMLAKRLALGGIVDFGAESINTCGGLVLSGANANGFVNKMQGAGFTKRFNWGEYNAWESDFKDNAFAGGNDLNYVDNTDIVFYTGHANGDGFVFCDSTHTDTFLHYNDARWGNQDLEWLVIAACGPLQNTSSGLAWWQRWGPSFDGLHLLMGYATTSYDGASEGSTLAEYMLGKPLFFWTLPPLPVRSAWVNTAIEAQPASVTWSIMGVYGAGGVSNYNDFFWTKGPVGPDLRGGSIHGYWKISGGS